MNSRRRMLELTGLWAVLVVVAPNGAWAQWHYYYFDEPQRLALDVERIAVFRREQTGEGAVAAAAVALSGFGIQAQDVRPSVIPRMSIALTPASRRSEGGVKALVTSIADAEAVEFVSPVFLDSFGPRIITRHLHVGFRPHVTSKQAEAILAQMNAGVIEARDWSRMKGVYRLLSGSRNGFDVLATANKLAEHPDVNFAEPDMVITGRTSDVFPNDPGFSLCWGLHNTGQSGGTPDMDMDAPEAWDYTMGDPGIIVVVMDVGAQQDHPDINQVPGQDFTGEGTGGGPGNQCDGHGTTVEGTISAIINNNLGTVGVAPAAKSASARWGISTVPCDGTFSAFNSWLVDALDWAQTIGARVTNSSFSMGGSSSISNKYSSTRQAGVIHFAAAGNGGFGSISYPSSLSTVNSVAALNRTGARASFSQWGDGLFISAPGQSIYTTDETGGNGFCGGDYCALSGTSYASPYTAGVAALVLSLDPSLSPTLVEQVLASTAVDLGAAGYDTGFGWGFVNAFGAVTAVSFPLIPCEMEKVTASDAGQDDEFGRSVSISGDVAVIGAYLDDDGGADAGAVYIYRRSGMVWNEEDKLFAGDAAAGDMFGSAVAIEGNIIVVGASGDDLNTLTDAGSAYVFRWNGVDSFVEEQKLIAADAATGDAFGASAAISGDVIVVAATRVDGGGTDSGAVYVFRWNGSAWTQEQKLTAFDAAQFDNFGSSVSVSGDVLVASSPNDDDDGSGSGSVYVYRWNGGSWALDQKLTASDAAAGDRFGRSVSMEGNDLLIGAYRDDGGGLDAGSAYWFSWNGFTWNERQEFFASDAVDGDRFGQSVALSGDRVVVGAYLDDSAGGNAGSVYVFRRGGGGWVQDAELTASDPAASDELGYAVAIDGNFAVAGAHFDDLGASANAGSAYILAVAGDCDENNIVDTCDIIGDPTLDQDSDGVIDACACLFASIPGLERLDLPGQPESVKNRFISIQAGDAGNNQAIRVRFVSLPSPFDIWNGMDFFVGAPHQVCENAGQGLETPAPGNCAAAPGLPRNWLWAAPLVCDPLDAHYDDWTQYDVIHLYHEGFVPNGVYDVQLITEGCSISNEGDYSPPLQVTQPRWGDIVENCGTDPCGPPDGVVSVTADVTAVLDKFKNLSGAPVKARADLEPAEIDFKINITDAVEAINAFTGGSYSFAPGDPCSTGMVQ